jgi:hypothetical protein
MKFKNTPPTSTPPIRVPNPTTLTIVTIVGIRNQGIHNQSFNPKDVPVYTMHISNWPLLPNLEELYQDINVTILKIALHKHLQKLINH